MTTAYKALCYKKRQFTNKVFPCCELSFSIVCGVIYAPCFLIDGRTSDVTQRLNCFASGSLLDIIRLYKPDSLIVTTFCLPPGVSILDTPLSSSSTLSRIAFAHSLYPSFSATSFPINHGSPSISNTVRFPKSGWVKMLLEKN